MRRLLAALLALTAVLTLAGMATARAQDVNAESAFASLITRDRTSHGLAAYANASDLQAVARRHAQRMADRQEPYHNPNLADEVDNWQVLAENVGMGGTVEGIHQKFMESQYHRDSILSTELTQVGVGVVRDAGGTIWVVEVFRRPMTAASPAPAPAPAPQPSPAPAPVPAPTTTAPPAPPTTPPSAPTTTVASAPAEATAVASATAGRSVPLHEVAVDVAAAPELPGAGEVAAHVPGAARAAALLLAAVVGFQAVVLRRLGLVVRR